MQSRSTFEDVPGPLAAALEQRGFAGLTAIQEAVLAAPSGGRDLRLSSATGSGKTVALGMAIARALGAPLPSPAGEPRIARPLALVVAPTRELATQIAGELEWLLFHLGARIAVVTGGLHIGGDFRKLAANPHLLVGTPGRLVDHLRRGTLDLGAIDTVVLDEADEMLDMGFRDDLEMILDAAPAGRKTHMVSATFPREVLHLADRYQREAVVIRGANARSANPDIAYVGHCVNDGDRTATVVNVLLTAQGQRALVFVQTRSGTHSLAETLARLGFAAAALSGEMGQRERNATLEAFRSGAIQVLVATDVAGRGLDIEDVGFVIHFDPPESSQALTHRSGRTGRAGKKGTSVVLASPRQRGRVTAMARRLGLQLAWSPPPSPERILRVAGEHWTGEILADDTAASDHERELASLLLAGGEPIDVVASLLRRAGFPGPCEPRQIEEAAAPAERKRATVRGPRDRDFIRFHINWGARAGATASRLVAMVCRHCDVRGADLGAIRVGDHSSTIEVSGARAEAFATAAGRRDPKNPKIRIRRWEDRAGASSRPRANRARA